MQQAFLGIRILTHGGTEPVNWSVVLPPGYALIASDHASGQNAKEFFFHIWVPDSMAATDAVLVKVDARRVRAVLASYTDIGLAERYFVRREQRANGIARVNYQSVPEGIIFPVPAGIQGASLPPDDLADVSEHYTFIETPGVYIRIGHADQARRRGAYSNGAWVAVEAKAALNLQFAAREAIKALRLDSLVQRHGAQTIMLMNFDTNYPTLGPDDAHEDWPPHWHMHLYWNDSPRVRKVGHFYIGPDGLLLGNQSFDFKSLDGRSRIKRWYPHGEDDKTTTPDGLVLYSQSITQHGHFKLTSAEGSCLLTPMVGGFDSGVTLAFDHDNKWHGRRIWAEDDPSDGRIRLFLNGRLKEDYRYDPDTGTLLAMKTGVAGGGLTAGSSGSEQP